MWGEMASCGGLATRLPQASEGRLPIGRKMPSCPSMRCAQAFSGQLSAFSFSLLEFGCWLGALSWCGVYGIVAARKESAV